MKETSIDDYMVTLRPKCNECLEVNKHFSGKRSSMPRLRETLEQGRGDESKTGAGRFGLFLSKKGINAD